MYGIGVIVTKTDTASAIRAKVAELLEKRSVRERMLHDRNPDLIGVVDNQVVSRRQDLTEDPTRECKIRIFLMPDVPAECIAISGDSINERIPDVSFTELQVVAGETMDDYTTAKVTARAHKRLMEDGAQKVWMVTSGMRVPNKVKSEFSDVTIGTPS